MECFNSYVTVLNPHCSHGIPRWSCAGRGAAGKEEAAPAGARRGVLGTLRGEFLRPVKKKKYRNFLFLCLHARKIIVCTS